MRLPVVRVDIDLTAPPEVQLDVNGDSLINILDLVMVASHFGGTGASPADVNGDGIVNIADLVLVANEIGGGAGTP